MSPRPIEKKPRAFIGLVGRNTSDPADLSLQDLIAINQIPRSLILEAEAIEQRRQSGVFDPAEEFKDESYRFQKTAFDPKLRGTDPRSFENGNGNWVKLKAGGGTNLNPITKTFAENGGPGGFQIEGPEDWRQPRSRAPWWLLEDALRDQFLRSLIEETPDDPQLKGKALRAAGGLDWIILEEFYFDRVEDQAIFETYKEFFRHEHDGKPRKRWTSSANAVKLRRRALVRRGDELFGSSSRPLEGTEHQEHLARWAPIRALPDLKKSQK